MLLNALRPGTTTSLTAALSSLTLKTARATTTRTTTPTASRAFSTTPRALTKTIPLQRIPDDQVPPYPYGPRLVYKQSNNGLYGSARIRRGHNVSEKHHQVSPRVWKPNVHRRRLWSDALGAWVRTRLTIRVLRTVRREGGLDAYVLKNKAARVRDLGPGGWKLRWLVMQTAPYRERMLAERRALGVVRPPPGDNTLLVPLVVKASLRREFRPEDDALIEEMAARVVAERRAALESAALERAAADYALSRAAAEAYALGEEAVEAEMPGDEQFPKEYIEGQKTDKHRSV